MKATPQGRVLEYLADLGLTLDILAHLPDADLREFPGPDGPLTHAQILLIKAAVNEAALARTGTRTNKRLEALEQENKALREVARSTLVAREENLRLRAEVGRRKQRVSDIMSSYRHTVNASVDEVCLMIGTLASIGNNLDICFVMDATGSMAVCINGVKQSIARVAQNITSTTGMTARFALVAYRDYCDGALRHQVFPFGDSFALSDSLNALSASGGGDEAEDCFGGLWIAANRLLWAAPARVIMWMGDSPQHGTQYSGGNGDSLPGGDQDGVTAAMIFSELQNKHINLIFCKLTENTNLMIAQMKLDSEPYGSIQFLCDNFGGEMTAFLTNSLHRTISLTAMHGHYHHRGIEKPYILTPALWNLDELWGSEEACEVLTFEAYHGGDLHPLLDILIDGPNAKARKATVRMTLNPVEKGEMRFAFYGKIIEESDWKLSKREKKVITKVSRYEGSHNSRNSLINQAHIQAVATLLAKEFTLKLAACRQNKKVVYVSVELLRIHGRTTGDSLFVLEPFIPGRYVKFNNNNGFVDKDLEVMHPLMQTFSHFTYSYSSGVVMVTDVQGVIESEGNYKLTDPAIHTADPSTYLKDPTNLGKDGMAAFFHTHICNHFCQTLFLKRPENLDVGTSIDQAVGFYDNSHAESDREDSFLSFS